MPNEPLLLDVRPILASGGQPLAAIDAAVDCLRPGQALRLLAPFRPQPLFRLMEGKGFDAHPVDLPDGGCEVLFTPREEAGDLNAASAIPSPLTWPDPVLLLDLTGRPSGEASERILATLELQTEGEVIFVLLDGEPAFLYSDLTSRRHGWVGNYDAAGETYRILIRRGASIA
ncbi:DUF2249 domain-containing protein [Gellertiella hungarica]|uniref:Uncharacterized protein (DUF2249 family) n=1 Tax=Gellertiella hungarica TaxID=1572859 RepID=A0A7W6J7I8_9HYPH|nr:DUF2249 domain-containing protein [Gellertiella hungarica]MBB4065387.1 uncharacterized protein (DUF2249 family) [Gellertiella hungarica]